MRLQALAYSLTVLAHYCLLGTTPKDGRPSNGNFSGASSDFGGSDAGDLPFRRAQPSVMTLLGLQRNGPKRDKHDHHDLPLWMSDDAANFILQGLQRVGGGVGLGGEGGGAQDVESYAAGVVPR